MNNYLLNTFNDLKLFEEIPNTIIKYYTKYNKLTINEKIEIASETDNLLQIGNYFYRNGDISSAISHYHLAIQSFPINNDALQNLYVCYEELNMTLEKGITKYAWEIVKDLRGI